MLPVSNIILFSKKRIILPVRVPPFLWYLYCFERNMHHFGSSVCFWKRGDSLSWYLLLNVLVTISLQKHATFHSEYDVIYHVPRFNQSMEIPSTFQSVPVWWSHLRFTQSMISSRLQIMMSCHLKRSTQSMMKCHPCSTQSIMSSCHLRTTQNMMSCHLRSTQSMIGFFSKRTVIAHC